MDRNNKLFIAASLANGASFSMILPLLAPLVRELHLTEIQGGAMVSVGALLMAIAAIYISKNQSKFSIYQLLSIGFVGMAFTWGIFTGVLMYGLSSHVGMLLLFSLLMLSRAATGIFMAMPQIALQSYVMTTFNQEQQRSQAMSKFGALNSAGVIIGPFLTTLLLGFGGMMTPLWGAIIILSIISAVLVIYFDRMPLNQSTSRIQQAQSEAPSSQFSLKHCYSWLMLGFSLYLAIVTVNLTAGFYIQDRFEMSTGQGAVHFAECSLIVGIALVIMQTLISKYLNWSVYRLLWVGLVSMAVALFISVMTSELRIFQLTYLLYGISVACLIPAFTTGAAQTAPSHLQTKVASWCTATQALSFVVGPLISTGLYQWQREYPYYFLLTLMLLLMSFFVLQTLKMRQINKTSSYDVTE
ncbi:MFS transporter [Acinetobacter sp. ANC 5054]|uniref:MFS transporter n=1 Tax=Acinetobacter sp. ANC 5054 TaxID=1977877 RepID=UPI000A34DF36|nr:MFS transporter [Acinetobacter sp. ANC 5054]OTG79503.1 MFS transporter [Acinetobacter sp. ANC 5054]